jgi:prevent-host-death family protein
MSVIKIERDKATASLADYVEQAAGNPIVITESGKPIAILLSAAAADLETLSLSSNPEFWKIIEHSRASDESKSALSLEEVRLMFADNNSDIRVADEETDYRTDSPAEQSNED